MKTNFPTPLIWKSILSSTIITAILLIIGLFRLCFLYQIVHRIKLFIPGIERYGTIYYVGLLLQLALCISIAVTIFLLLKFAGNFRLESIILSILGTLAFCNILIEGVAMNEFYSEYYLRKWNADFELSILNMGMILNLVFIGSGLWMIIKSWIVLRFNRRRNHYPINETVFEMTQYIGIACGIIGALFAYYGYLYLHHYRNRLKPDYIDWVYTCCLIFLLPYLSVIIFWILKLFVKRDRTLYDEKQKRDLSNAGLTTWLLSILILAVLIIPNLKIHSPALGVMILPFYIFITLLIFSSTVLFNFKKT